MVLIFISPVQSNNIMIDQGDDIIPILLNPILNFIDTIYF